MPTKCAALAKLFSWNKISQGLLYFILLYPANKSVYKNAPVFLLDAPLRLKMHRFAPLRVSYHNLHFYPTMRTDLDIGAEKSETTTVSDFFYTNFAVEFNRYPPPEMAFGEDLN